MAQQQRSELARLIGLDAVNALAAKFPGQRIYVPWSNQVALDRFMENFAPLIGADKVTRLVEYHGGCRIIIPSRTQRRNRMGSEARNLDLQKLSELVASGLNASQIAKVMNCDPRSVYRAKHAAKRKGYLKYKNRKPYAMTA